MELQEAINYVIRPEPFDESKYLEAGNTLVEKRDELTYAVFYKIPDPGKRTTNLSAKWEKVRNGSTGERCSCGNCRTIWPAHIPEFKEGQLLSLLTGGKIYIVPKGSHYRHTIMKLEVVKSGENSLLHFTENPFADSVNFSDILSPKGYVLKKIAQVCSSRKEPMALMRKIPEDAGTDATDMTILLITAATENSITVAVGNGYSISVDPTKEGEAPIDINPNRLSIITPGG